MRMLTRRVPLVLAAAAALACGGVFTHDDSGRTQSVGFVTSLGPGDVHDRAMAWFARESYTLVDSAARLVRAEKLRPLAAGGGQQRDVLTVTIGTEAEGTRVTLDLITYLVEDGQTRQAAQVSPEGRSDLDRLSRDLMPRP